MGSAEQVAMLLPINAPEGCRVKKGV